MQAITEMPIPFLPVDDPEFHRDPMPFVDAARAQHAWLARFESGYVIHGYQALKDLASMDDKLDMGLRGVVSFYRAEATPWARFMTEMLQSHSGPDHKRLRDSVAVAFTPRAANRMRPRMRIVITELLDQWAPAGEMDFADFAAWFPVSVLCGVLGVSTEPIPRLRSAIETYMNLFTLDRSILGDFLAAYDQLYAFMTVHMLLEYPDYWRRCAEDTDFCTRVIEEMLRHSGIATCFREVREDFVYEDHLFPEGTLLAFATPLAGRDPAAFPDPLKFDPDRISANRHVAFGRGPHICLGQFLARAQLVEGLHLITRRIHDPKLAGEVIWRPLLGAWGLRTLPIRFDASTR